MVAARKARAAASEWLKKNGYKNLGLSAKFGSLVYSRSIPESDRKKRCSEYYKKNHSRELERIRKYQRSNRSVVRKSSKAWRDRNKAKCSEYSIKRRKLLRKTDSSFLLRDNLGNLVRNSLLRNGFSKKTKTAHIIGCNFEKFKRWIESNFKDGMSWENRGEWHIDHKFPVGRCVSQIDAEKSFNWENLTPIPASENCSKRHSLSIESLLLAKKLGISAVKIYNGEESIARDAESIGIKAVRK